MRIFYQAIYCLSRPIDMHYISGMSFLETVGASVRAQRERRGWTRRMRRQQIAAITKILTLHGAVVRKAAGFELYDRLFRIWHAVHVPMFVLLLVAVGLHVIAAHAH